MNKDSKKKKKKAILSQRGASRRYNVPKSTIIDKHYGKSSLHSRSGPKSVLSETDENIIVEWLINMAKIGYGQTRQQLLSAVKKVMDQDGRQTPFKNNLPGKDWFYAFMKRHPEIAPHTPQKLERNVLLYLGKNLYGGLKILLNI
jgi:hypothetical protein